MVLPLSADHMVLMITEYLQIGRIVLCLDRTALQSCCKIVPRHSLQFSPRVNANEETQESYAISKSNQDQHKGNIMELDKRVEL